jgi:hypothetical protein
VPPQDEERLFKPNTKKDGCKKSDGKQEENVNKGTLLTKLQLRINNN